MSVDPRLATAARWTAIAGAVLCIYLPDIGHGFVQDDFAWILQARGDVVDSISRAFTTSLGFFRPIVTLSFTLSEKVFGLEPYWYGVTNLLLAFACLVAIERLGRALGLAPAYAMLAAAVWIFNFHGINMSVLWISGRTSLLSTLFAVLAASAFERRKTATAAAWTMFALLSKEDAVLIPFILATWRLVDAGPGGSFLSAEGPAEKVEDPPGMLRGSWPLFVALGAYVLLRGRTDAFTPLNAPEFYRFTADPTHLVRNLVEYLDRSATTGALVLMGLMAIARGMPRLDRVRSTMLLKGAIWWLGGFAVTMWLPVRSSLYAVFPSVGVALMVGVLAASVVPALSRQRRRALLILGLVAPFLLLPVYRSRNERWVELADLSTATLAHTRARLSTVRDHAIVELADDRDRRDNFTNAFGGLLPEASELFLERQIELQIAPAADPIRQRQRIRLADVHR